MNALAWSGYRVDGDEIVGSSGNRYSVEGARTLRAYYLEQAAKDSEHPDAGVAELLFRHSVTMARQLADCIRELTQPTPSRPASLTPDARPLGGSAAGPEPSSGPAANLQEGAR